MLAKAVPLRVALFSLAALAVLCGWFQLTRFSTTPGEQSPAPAILPAGLFPANHLPLLLVFVHPQCSCTPATFEQLDRLLNQAGNSVELVLAVYDSAALQDADKGRKPIHPGALLHHPFRLFADLNGSLARRFGAATSGEILLYSPNRQLLFQGGITPGRGHTGDSPVNRALLAAIASGRPASSASQSAVFGCPIFRLAHPG